MKSLVVRIIVVAFMLMGAAFGQTPTSEVERDRRMSELERKVATLEAKRENSGPTAASTGGLSVLFGAFCALWAQNTKRSPWLWFFLGLFFSVIAVIFLLAKNGDDRFAGQQWERYTGKPR